MNLKQYITEKNLLYLLIFILLTTTFIDIFTALKNPIFRLGESNPIYLITGKNALFFTVLVLIITFYMILRLKKSISLPAIFIFTLVTIYASIGHIGGAISNIRGEKMYNENPEEIIKYYQSVSNEEKYTSYFTFVFIYMILPVLASFLAFITALYFHRQRQPEREKIIDKIQKLTFKLNK